MLPYLAMSAALFVSSASGYTCQRLLQSLIRCVKLQSGSQYKEIPCRADRAAYELALEVRATTGL